MQKLIVSLILTASVLTAQAQTKLTYDIHALKAGLDNPMSLCSYSDPGVTGEDITWDFSSLTFQEAFTGIVKGETDVADFSESNVILNEFGSKFFFNLSETQLEQTGYMSKSGSSKMIYDVPFVKMKYPFAMGDYFSGAFSGEYILSDKKYSDIDGEYYVEADAYGKILLPENKTIENVLRVKEEKNYTLTGKINRDVKITTYRWYNSTHTYPVLVLTEIKTITSNKERISHQAAYNSNVISYAELKSASTIPEINSTELYPTVVTNNLNLKINTTQAGDINIRIIDAAGKLAKQFTYSASEGNNTISLSSFVPDLSAGNYVVEITSNDEKVTKNFVRLR